jgi:hypothetical protein
METINLNGIEYVKKDDAQLMSEKLNGLTHAIVRTQSAGVFAGYIKERNGKEGTLLNARRIWYWDGAASLSQLAIDGTSLPDKCKFPAPVPSVILTEIIEIIPTTEKAKISIDEVKIWKK